LIYFRDLVNIDRYATGQRSAALEKVIFVVDRWGTLIGVAYRTACRVGPAKEHNEVEEGAGVFCSINCGKSDSVGSEKFLCGFMSGFWIKIRLDETREDTLIHTFESLEARAVTFDLIHRTILQEGPGPFDS